MKINIYQIWFPTSKKSYIGQTDNMKRRMIAHLSSDYLVGQALRKYDDWVICVLHSCTSRDAANRLEIDHIHNFNSVSPNGYNLTAGGAGGAPSEETKKNCDKRV